MPARDISADLAYTLDIEPSTVLQYKQYPEGYSVITTDYKKFTAVHPTAKPAPPIPTYPEGLPEELKPVYDDPLLFKVQELRELAYFLEIPNASALRKSALQEEISAWKKVQA